LGKQSLWVDEGYTLNGAQAVLEHGYPLLDSGEIYTNNFLPVYLTAGVMTLHDFDPYNPWPERLPSVVFGTASIIALFYLAREIFKRNYVALASSGIMAFSYWEIAWSRQIRGYALCTFFVILFLFFLWRYLKGVDGKYLWYALLALTLASLSHWVALVFLPVVIAALVVTFFSKSDNQETTLVSVVSGLCIVECLILFLFWRENAVELYSMSISYNNLTPLFFGALIGLMWSLVQRKNISETVFLFSPLLLSVLMIVPFSAIFHSRYLFPFVPVCIVLLSYAGVSITERVCGRGVFSKIVSAILLLICLYSSLSFMPRALYRLEIDSAQPDFSGVFRVISSERLPEDVVVSAYPMMHMLYLGEKGMWFPSYLNPNNAPRVKNGYQTDYYVDAPLIAHSKELEKILREKSGFVLATSDTPKDAFTLLEKNTRMIYSSGMRPADRLWLFEF
jgi:4-amino-4-deoxy-L-arabinose transferase-like glycosyltransferase